MMLSRLTMMALGLVIGLAGAAPAAASRWHGGPFSPTDKVIDHTVVLEVHLTNPNRDVVRTVRRKGAWARSTDRSGGRDKDSWLNLRSRTSAERFVDAKGETVTVRKENDQLYIDRFDLQPRPTGRTDRLLGETCRVWEVWRSKRTEMRHESCVTDDGIELWYRSMSSGRVGETGRAVSISRAPLRRGDVMPPANLLSRDRFLAAARRLAGGYVSPIPDHVVSYGLVPGASEERRSGSWSGKIKGLPGARTLGLRDDASGANLSLSRDYRSGALSELHLFLPAVAVTAGRPVMPDRNGPTAIVAGELCWPPPKPASAEGVLIIDGYESCLSVDGILLRWSHAGRIHTGETAASVVRRKVRFEEVFPRETPMSNRAWGLTD